MGNSNKTIPFPVNLHGLALIGLMLFVLINAQKNVIKLALVSTIKMLTVTGIVIVLSSETIFQIARNVALEGHSLNEHIYYFFYSLISMTLFGLVLSFMVAFQLVKKNTMQLVLIIFGFLILINILKYLYPNLVE
jgi:hypothetical protein